jgi:trimeric autotransporter adhesin
MKKTNSKMRLAVLLLSTLCLLASAYAQLTPLGDAYTNTADPATNYGAKTLLDVESSQTTYIQFNLSSIPSGYTGADITKATLKLYVNAVTTAGSFNVDYVNGTWTESTITHNLAPALGTTIVASVPLTTADKNQYVLIDITAAVQAWLSGTSNDGIALVGNSPVNVTFDSKESTTTSHPPELDIVFAGGGSGITGITTASGSGLIGGGTSGTLNLSLTKACAAKQILQWSGSAWACASAGTGTITGVTAGTDLTGGGTSGNVTLNLNTSATNALYAQLAAANTFTANQTVNGTLTATSSVTGIVGSATATAGNASGVLGESQSTSGYGIQGLATAATGTTFGVFGGTVSPAGFGVSGQQFAATGNTAGVYGTTASTSGYGVEGTGPYIGVYGTGSEGVLGVSSSASGYGVQGEATSGTGTNYGVFGISDSPAGYGVYGENFVTTGTTAGVYGTTASPAGYGVEGLNANSSGVGIYGSGGTGVEGVSTSASGPGGSFTGYSAPSGSNVNGTDGVDATGGNGDPSDVMGGAGNGVVGTGGSAAGGGGCYTLHDCPGVGGVFVGGASAECYEACGGDGIDALAGAGCCGVPASWAGYFTGDVWATGTINSGEIDFKIDHPLDPANKYLVHASVESSEMMNIYTGNVTTDAKGEATVQLPEWFEVLNTDFRYQLTVIGQFAQAIVGHKIENNRFEIRTSVPNVEVSWQVTGVRQDAYARAHPLVVEQEKEARLRAFYIHPELYGAPAEKQIEWARHPHMMKRIKEMQTKQQATIRAAAQRPTAQSK